MPNMQEKQTEPQKIIEIIREELEASLKQFSPP